jgi:hypothetical protein
MAADRLKEISNELKADLADLFAQINPSDDHEEMNHRIDVAFAQVMMFSTNRYFSGYETGYLVGYDAAKEVESENSGEGEE